jgi:hypothetical protein
MEQTAFQALFSRAYIGPVKKSYSVANQSFSFGLNKVYGRLGKEGV